MKKKIVAMLLAGGQGSRLGVLTSNMAKPAVPFGGKYRIIDFPLSNCVNSDIDTVGVLTQYRPLALNSYIGTGQHWDLDRQNGGVFVLPPYMTGSDGHWYSGTANAIYQNREFVEQYRPDYVLILSGDHIYKMDYAKMLAYHVQKKAAATIAVLPVPMEEAHRFGITFHRQKRSKAFIHSELENIEGVGPKTIELLLRHFRTVEKIRTAPAEELSALIGPAKAARLLVHFGRQ